MDQKFSDLRKAALTPPPNLPANPVPPVPGKEPAAEGPGMGSYVQQLHAQGLRGTALAAAIHTELRRRGVGAGHGKPGGPKPDAPSDKGKPGVEPDNAPKSKSPSAPGPGTSPSKGKGKARARKCRRHRRRSSP